MSDLGALLKEARQKKGYTLNDIQEMTKIRVRYLEAIEAGDYKVLPGSFYARAFIKNYAEAVGLDAEELLQQHQNEVPALPTEPISEQPMMKPRRASARASDRWSKWGFGILLWCFLALIAVIVYVFVLNNPNDPPPTVDPTNLTENTEDNDPQTAPGGTETPDNGAETPDSSETPDGAGTPDTDNGGKEPQQPSGETTLTPIGDITRRTTNYELSPKGVHKYEVIVSGESWVEFRNEETGDRLVYETLKDTTKTFELSAPVYISLGFAPSVQIKVDGQALHNGGESGTSKRYNITPVDSPSAETDTQ